VRVQHVVCDRCRKSISGERPPSPNEWRRLNLINDQTNCTEAHLDLCPTCTRAVRTTLASAETMPTAELVYIVQHTTLGILAVFTQLPRAMAFVSNREGPVPSWIRHDSHGVVYTWERYAIHEFALN